MDLVDDLGDIIMKSLELRLSVVVGVSMVVCGLISNVVTDVIVVVVVTSLLISNVVPDVVVVVMVMVAVVSGLISDVVVVSELSSDVVGVSGF